jgi:uncharacterized protein
MVEESKRTFRILSLDGGGVRGVFQAAYLVRLAQQLSKHSLGNIADNFDLIAGTSTGSIIGMAVALGIDPNQVLEFYKTKAPLIFPKRGWLRTKASYLTNGPRYDHEELKAPMVELFGNAQLGQAKTKILITASSIQRFNYRIFTNWHDLGSIDDNLAAVDAVLASAAAPTYFQSHNPTGEDISYIDGGLWANSPSLVAIIAAHRLLKIPFEKITLLSLATGDFPHGVDPSVFNDGRPIWQISPIMEMMFSCQSKFADDYAAHLLGEQNVIRISTPLDEMMALDDAESAINELPALANFEAQNSLKKVMEMLQREPAQPIAVGPFDIMNTEWAADWRFDEVTPFVQDRVFFTKWTGNNQFDGFGKVLWDTREYKYSITGEVSRNGIVVLTYKAENYPTEANIGMACMELSSNAEQLIGYWSGRHSIEVGGKKVYTVRSGPVTMQKVRTK